MYNETIPLVAFGSIGLLIGSCIHVYETRWEMAMGLHISCGST